MQAKVQWSWDREWYERCESRHSIVGSHGGSLSPVGVGWTGWWRAGVQVTGHLVRGHLFLRLSPVFLPCPRVLVFLWCHLSWLSSAFTCFLREVTVFSSSATRDSRFSLEEGLGEGISFLGKSGLCLAGFSSG